jgi:hypothetical protein
VGSGDDLNVGWTAVAIIKKRLAELGLKVNGVKETKTGFQPRGHLQDVHGAIVNSPEGVAIHPRTREEYIALANDYVATCRSVQASTLEIVKAKRATLVGKIAYARRLRGSKFRHLRRLLKLGDRKVNEWLAATNASCVDSTKLRQSTEPKLPV